MAFCLNCGTQIAAGGKFCPKCGTAVPANGTSRADSQAPQVDAFVKEREALIRQSEKKQASLIKLLAILVAGVIALGILGTVIYLFYEGYL